MPRTFKLNRSGGGIDAQHFTDSFGDIRRHRHSSRPMSLWALRVGGETMREHLQQSLEIGGATRHVGEPHRAMLAAGKQNAGVSGRGDLAALILTPHVEIDGGTAALREIL